MEQMYPNKRQRKIRIKQINRLINVLAEEKTKLSKQLDWLRHEEIILENLNDLEENIRK